ncbi:MAG: hypothetical protein J1F02_06815 [Lachnospiraceae bacterium]|nr:hypothetical protein [Lachnospiraceae bacterium]
MKKIIALSVCFLLLTACTTLKNNAGNDSPNTATDSAITGSSITASAVSGGVVSAEAVSGEVTAEKRKIGKGGKKKAGFVIDETGKSRKLNLGKVNTGDVGVNLGVFDSQPVGLYSQVSGGHYYYMKSDGKHNYTIYRDKGEKMGQFSFDIDSRASGNFLEYFVKYGSEYYALLMYEYSKGDDDDDLYDIKTYLAQVDLKKGKAEPILKLTDRSYGDLYLYQKGLYFEDQSTIDDDIDWSEFEWYDFPGDFVKMDMKKDFSETKLSSTKHLDRQLGCLTFMDGKIYYGVQKGKKVTLYSYDLKTKREEKILFKVHRFTKKTYEDMIISNMKAMDVKCTEDSVYVQEYDEALSDEGEDDYVFKDDNPASTNVYYMDINGEHVEKIADGVAREIDETEDWW